MDNIRLLQVLPSLNSGGVEQGTIDVAKAIVKSGNFSSVASNGGNLIGKLKMNGIKHYNLPVDSKNPIVMFNNIINLKKILFNEKINILHTRSRAPAWSSYYAGKKNVKLVSTFHNIYGHENSFKKFYNSGLAKADRIIAISNFVKNKIIDLYNISEKKITVIYRGIDEEIYDINKINEELLIDFIKKYNIVNDKKIILFPGRLTSWKGQIEFLNVLKKLKYKDFFCYFVGDEKNIKYSNKLLKEIENYKLTDHCKVMGHIDDMRYFYKVSHLVVNASIKPEGFGRVVSEGMLMKKPVIAYNHGGVSEQITIYDEDLIISPNDQNKMSNTIDNILSMNQEKIDSIGQLSAAFVKKNFTKKTMIFHTLDLYKNLLKL